MQQNDTWECRQPEDRRSKDFTKRKQRNSRKKRIVGGSHHRCISLRNLQNAFVAKLVFVDPSFGGQVYQFSLEKTTVGRSDQNTLVIRHPSVSSVQCEILVHDPEVIVRDLGSKNGTVVNGRKLRNQQSALKHGQMIRFGSVEARLELESDPCADTTANTAAHEHLRWVREEAKPKVAATDPAVVIGGEAPPDSDPKTVFTPVRAIQTASERQTSKTNEALVSQAESDRRTPWRLVVLASLALTLVLLWLFWKRN